MKSSGLTADEQTLFERSFNRQFIDHQDEVELVTLYEKNKATIRAFCEIMKYQFNRKFGGQQAGSDEFGMTELLPHYLGYANWEVSSVTAAGAAGASTTLTKWLDDHTPRHANTGTGGLENPFQVGRPIGHLIFGYRSYHEIPKAIALVARKNQKPINTWWMENRLRGSQRRIYEADMAIQLVPQDYFAAELVGDEDGGVDYPALIGVSFIKGQWLKEYDQKKFIGTSTEYPIVVGTVA